MALGLKIGAGGVGGLGVRVLGFWGLLGLLGLQGFQDVRLRVGGWGFRSVEGSGLTHLLTHFVYLRFSGQYLAAKEAVKWIDR